MATQYPRVSIQGNAASVVALVVMTPDRQDARALAEARFKQRERQKADAPLALKEYYAAEEAQREKTRRLRALRLASAAAKSQG